MIDNADRRIGGRDKGRVDPQEREGIGARRLCTCTLLGSKISRRQGGLTGSEVALPSGASGTVGYGNGLNSTLGENSEKLR